MAVLNLATLESPGDVLPKQIQGSRRQELEEIVQARFKEVKENGMVSGIEAMAHELADKMEHPNGSALFYKTIAISSELSIDVNGYRDKRVKRVFEYFEQIFKNILEDGKVHAEKVATYMMMSRKEWKKLNGGELYHSTNGSDFATDIRDSYYAGLLHDSGKGIRPILTLLEDAKGRALTPTERDVMKLHPVVSFLVNYRTAELLEERNAKDVPDLKWMAYIDLYHHEDSNGEGYSIGLKGEEIPLASRFLRVFDSAAAMGRKREHDPETTVDVVCNDIQKGASLSYTLSVLRKGIHEKSLWYVHTCTGDPNEMFVRKIAACTNNGDMFPETVMLKPKDMDPMLITYNNIHAKLPLPYLIEAYTEAQLVSRNHYCREVTPIAVKWIRRAPSLITT